MVSPNSVVANASIDRHGPSGPRGRSREGVLRTIAVFKLVKAILLIAVGLGSLNLLNPTTSDTADRWASALAWRLGPRAAFAVHEKFSSLRASHLRVAGIAAFLFAALFAVEAGGLWMTKRWAEYLTIIATLSLVPFEVYELIRQSSWQRGATLGINLLVVGYLVWKVRQRAA
jgi:uncharacterized membrane protein (DUF2068 family)